MPSIQGTGDVRVMLLAAGVGSLAGSVLAETEDAVATALAAGGMQFVDGSTTGLRELSIPRTVEASLTDPALCAAPEKDTAISLSVRNVAPPLRYLGWTGKCFRTIRRGVQITREEVACAPTSSGGDLREMLSEDPLQFEMDATACVSPSGITFVEGRWRAQSDAPDWPVSIDGQVGTDAVQALSYKVTRGEGVELQAAIDLTLPDPFEPGETEDLDFRLIMFFPFTEGPDAP